MLLHFLNVAWTGNKLFTVIYCLLFTVYCLLLVRKLKFHERYPAFPGSLAMDKEALMMVGNNDAGSFYEMCIEFLDYLEDIINLETGVFESLGMLPVLCLCVS